MQKQNIDSISINALSKYTAQIHQRNAQRMVYYQWMEQHVCDWQLFVILLFNKSPFWKKRQFNYRNKCVFNIRQIKN